MARLALSILSCLLLSQTSQSLFPSSDYYSPLGEPSLLQNYSAGYPAATSYVNHRSLFHSAPSGPSGPSGYASAFTSEGSIGLDHAGYFGLDSAPQPPPQASCSVPIPHCVDSKYRTIDGSCNNLKNPLWGTPNTQYARLLPAKYADGIHAVPVSVSGVDLPLTRLVSVILFPDLPINDPVWTLITMTWGQIISHDMSMSMGTSQGKAHSKFCCTEDGQLGEPAPICFPIIIPDDDPVFKHYHRNCMNFVRSTTDIDKGCNPGHAPAEQLVVVTHWMDASFIYGSDEELARKLREGNGGRLLTEFRYGRPWPPAAQNKSSLCDGQARPDGICYEFGDTRGNQNPQLTVLQILFLREHNRVATVLAHINPHWDDETLYQEARRIVIAEYQHINYYEWLPIILGTDNMVKFGLIQDPTSPHKDYVNDYNDHIEPNTLNEHATAGFRYLHSSIQGYFHMFNEYRKGLGTVRLSDVFNRPEIIEDGDNMDALTRGLSTQSQEQVDPFFTAEITNYLFRNGKPFGRDLRAIDFQRGRDHGLAGYNEVREFCGLPRAHKFQDFADYIEQENVEKLATLYTHPDDVDLGVGGSLERHVENTLLGPTFLCLALEQFYRTRVSDRFFYEQGHSPNTFTPEQLHEIRKSSLARLLCDNSDNVHTMQPEGFRKISESNPLVPCNDYEHIPALDLNFWKDAHVPYSGYDNDYKKK